MKTLFTALFGVLSFTMLSAQSFHCLTEHFSPVAHHHQPAAGPLQSRTVTVLPVVVHIVYNSPSENLTDQKIYTMIEKLNLDFRRHNPDTTDTPDAFKPLAGDTQIEFALVSTDPWGNPTTGITRTQTSVDHFSILDGNINGMKYDNTGGKSAWNTYHFINIWIANLDLDSGFATGPGTQGEPHDGIVLDPFIITFQDYRVVTHEMGHYLGLPHIYGPDASCNFDDGIEDTPVQGDFTSPIGDCPIFPMIDACAPEAPGIMFMNYMDAAPDCQNMFTHGQAAVMQTMIATERQLLLEPFVNATHSAEAEKAGMQVFPNPAHNQLQVQFAVPLAIDRVYVIYDGTGRLMGQYSMEKLSGDGGADKLELTALAPGMYWLECRAEGRTFAAKFVKQ